MSGDRVDRHGLDLDVAEYPDSGKIGVWGKRINRVYLQDNDVGYYEGE